MLIRSGIARPGAEGGDFRYRDKTWKRLRKETRMLKRKVIDTYQPDINRGDVENTGVAGRTVQDRSSSLMAVTEFSSEVSEERAFSTFLQE